VFPNNSHDTQRASLKSTNFLRSLTSRQPKITRNIWFAARNSLQNFEALAMAGRQEYSSRLVVR
jgi:hypothetical protein